MAGKRFGILLCADDSEYVKKHYGGYFGVFLKLLGDEGDEWHGYRAKLSEFPGDDEIEAFDGFVISGSCDDAFSNQPWINSLIALVQKLDALEKKILGICFGHQILARALGGKIGRAKAGWSIGVRDIQLSPSPSTKLFLSLKVPSMLSIVKFHQDEVVELPQEAEVLAWSDNTKVEMFKQGNHILGIQGHPEYSKDIVHNIIDRLFNQDILTESIAEMGRTKLEAAEPDSEILENMCVRFLKYGF